MHRRRAERKRMEARSASPGKLDMALSGNGLPPAGGNAGRTASSSSPRCPRRIVLLCDGEDSAVAEVLAEYRGAEVSGNRLHAEIQKLAGANPGRCVAAEWLGSLGWTRFLWCRKENDQG
jgi:hypothetical protein